jgi:RimJ/RimL family protein N-acetyltransferase
VGEPSRSALIETARVRLRRLRPSDEHDLVALDSDPEVMRYVGSPAGVRAPAETLERVRARIADDQPRLGFWAVEEPADGRLLGLCALLPMPEGGDVELAYRLARQAWGRGLATEAAGALADHALGALALPRLVAVTYPDNHASQRVLDKLGFTRDGLRDYKGVVVTFHVLRAEARAALMRG